MFLELLHGLFDALEQMPGPTDTSSDWGHVMSNRRIVLLLLVQLLDLLKFQTVVLKDYCQLGVEQLRQIVTMKNGTKLAQQIEGVLDRRNELKRFVDEELEFLLKFYNTNAELYIVAVEPIVVIVQKSMIFASKVVSNMLELLNKRFHALKAVLG